MRKNQEFTELFGFHAVKAALQNNSRNHQKITLTKKNEQILGPRILRGIKNVLVLSIEEINKKYGKENNHQGIILETSKINQPDIKKILSDSKSSKEIIVMLDHVNDPNNIGSIIRSCSLFNCKTIIVSKDNAPEMTSSIAKAASGAIEVVNYLRVTNLSRTINEFKKKGFWVLGLDSNLKSQNNNSFIIPKKCLLVLGSESKGIRKLNKRECDEIISIPTKKNYNFEIESLNVSNACAIALYNHYIL